MAQQNQVVMFQVENEMTQATEKKLQIQGES